MLFVFVFAIKLLLVCYSACSLSLNTFAFEEIIYRNKEIEISSTDINMTNPEEGRKWFSRSVASMTNSPESKVLAHRWLLAKGKHLIVHLFVSCAVCFCVCN